jgi:hypothetical protein
VKIITNLNITLNWKKTNTFYEFRPDEEYEIKNKEVIEYLKEKYRNNIILVSSNYYLMLDFDQTV